jgi:glyoxylase-like metal-dependent hydrolase (beta-lactamase superfamily II)
MKSPALAAACAAVVLAAAPAHADLDAVSRAMGTPTTVEVSGHGQFFSVGQAFRPGLPWPKQNMVRYTRVDDYEKGASGVDYVLTRGDMLGGGAIPLFGEARTTGGVAGEQGWLVLYPMGLAVQAPATLRQHDLWISPHGIVKAAVGDKAAVQGGSFEITRPGKFKARATVNAENLVETVESWVDNPVLGDLPIVTTYYNYKDYGGVKFPSRIVQTTAGLPAFDLVVTDVKVNSAGVAVPAQIGPAVNDVKVDKAADGVWFIHGASHHSVAIEMRDHIILFEAPLGDGRTNAAIKAAKEAIPGKPIRYAVNTHHHFDHSGGLRAAAAEGATLIVHETARAYFEQVYGNPRTINPDALARSGKPVTIETVGDMRVLTDGARTVELHVLRNNQHADGFLIGYLPQEKILIVADAFSPRTPVTRRPAVISPVTGNLWENLNRLQLTAIETVLPIHGRMVKAEELRLEAGAQ